MTMGAIASQPAAAKTFHDQGYTWEIKDSEWTNMKRMAKAEYKNGVEQGRAIPVGYSNPKNITVVKNGIKYEGIVLAVKNEKSIRCEVRGVLSEGGYLDDYKNV